MATANLLTGLVEQLRRRCGDAPADGDLLAEFAANRDEAAFAELVGRHGGLVLGVARRHLPDRQAAEDVVQATFAALARSASRLGRPPSLVNWLYTVALRHARKTRLRFARRTALLRRVPPPLNPVDPLAEVSGRELVTIIDDELARLPAMYRLPLLLCALEGMSREEAARRLGWPIGSVKGRLERGRELLRTRLAARGLTVPAVLAGGLLTTRAQALPAAMVAEVTRAAVGAPAAAGSAKVALMAAVFATALGVGAGVALLPTDGPVKSPQTPAVAAAGPRTHLLGDPLPAGAVARLGSRRLRPGGGIQALAFSPDGRKFASWSSVKFQDGTMTIWETATGRELRRVTLPAAQLKGFHWLADGRGVAVLKLAPDDYYIWDFADEAAAPPPPRPNPQFNSYKPGDLLAVAVSPDGRWLATGRISGTSEPQPIELLELAVNQPLTALKSRVAGNQPGHGYKLVFSPDSSVLYAMSRSQEPNRQGAPIAGPGPGAPLTMGKQSDQARVGVYDVTSGQERASFEVTAPTGGSLVFPSGPATVALTADNRMIVTGHADGIVRLWDAATGEERRSWKTFEPTDPSKLTNAAVVGLALVGNQALVTVDGLGEQRRWDLTTGREIGKAMANRTSVQAMALSPDGKSVVAGGSAGTIYFWDIAAGVERPPAPGHSNSIDQLFISADSRTVQTASWDRTIRTWDLASGREQRCVALDGRGFPTAFTRDGRGLIGRTAWSNLGPPAPYDKFTWDTDTGKRHAVAGELADPRFWVLNAPNDGSLLVTDQQDQSVFLREWPSGQVRRKFPPPMLGPPATSYQTTAAVACADGQMVAVLGEDRWVMQHDHGWVSLFDAATGRVRFRQSTPDAHPRVAAVLADRAGVIVGGRTWVPATPVGEPRPLYKPQEALVLLDADSGELVRSFLPAKFRPDGFRSIMALAVSPDSRQLAAAEADFSVWVYEIATGRVRHHLAGHTNEVTALAFTPDGRRLVSTSRDLTGLVWDVSLAAADKAGSAPQATDVDRLWTDLAKRDWKDSGPSLATLATHPEAAVALLRERLKPANGPDGADPAALAALIARLDGAGFADRERAAASLRWHGSDALPAVRERVNQPASPELKQRLTTLVDDIQAAPMPADRVRELRAVELLEQIGTAAARDQLKLLAGGAAGAALTRAAADALTRLPK